MNSEDQPSHGPDAHATFSNGWPAASVLLVLFYLSGVTASKNFCATTDEVLHLTAGYTYWKLGDLRLQPENGNLPQRWAALPLLWGDAILPPLDTPAWNFSRTTRFGKDFLYGGANDAAALLLRGRAMIGLLSAGIGIVVYAWSRKLFGPAGAMLSLMLFCFCPMMLSHGFLATSDAAATLFFLLSLAAWWKLLHRLNFWTVSASALAMGGLFVCKFSAPIVLVMATILAIIRIAAAEPRDVRVFRKVRLARRAGQALVMIALAIVHLGAVLLVVWAFYDFRFSPFAAGNAGQAPPRLSPGWDWALDRPGISTSVIRLARDHAFAPDSYLFGLAHTLKMSRGRRAFADGYYSQTGWWWFFPYAMLIKTPIPTLLILLTALASYFRATRGILYRTAPLWVLIIVYGSAAIPSHLNIGVRHIMPVLPAMFILAGAVGGTFSGMGVSPMHSSLKSLTTRTHGRDARATYATISRFFLLAALAWLVAESLWVRPHYLAYFNEFAGGPARGYTHLVDSSLDWGQDLPGLKTWLREHHIDNTSGHRAYLSYFGNGSAGYEHIPATLLPSFGTQPGENPVDISPLQPGVYCISASILQGIYTDPHGPWTRDFEFSYQRLRASLATRPSTDPDADAVDLHAAMVHYRFARLCAFLRHRVPEDQVGYSILIFNLTRADLDKALNDPPAELWNQSPVDP